MPISRKGKDQTKMPVPTKATLPLISKLPTSGELPIVTERITPKPTDIPRKLVDRKDNIVTLSSRKPNLMAEITKPVIASNPKKRKLKDRKPGFKRGNRPGSFPLHWFKTKTLNDNNPKPENIRNRFYWVGPETGNSKEKEMFHAKVKNLANAINAISDSILKNAFKGDKLKQA